ncbi:Ferredoxin subunit of nitrite reductase or a ring-hydroxylating dioxygenase [Streptomyces zhaozhouensis]|uniref:Cytochrome bc1 complex Rieske iron-sulfur subunit n=1 Tax=Streptomyces zhaozhouensis TaxID=1300267 RepID=A0A286DZM7_9ACTN|nr:Rieske (2Fe-2S) protein [Streptomyces zhaozhouensis]SOD64044.1 Ferredoxin subunit of nitrite reductase or a ring-hydroxylating dioxygenase [Streptomyces zhaozhouensis]
MNGPGTTRRTAVLAGAAGLAAAALTACGSDDEENGAEGDGGTENGGAENGGSDGGAEELTSTADVPVGGGTILDEQKLVVTQPTEGEFLAFSSICTHQGCPVSQVTEEGILCTCHGSVFALADGSVVEGPATEPLPAEPITVEGESILRG